MQKITVIERLQAQVIELQITLCLEGRGQSGQVKLAQALVEQFVIDALFDELGEVVHIMLGHLFGLSLKAQDFFGNGVHQQSGCGKGVIGVLFNQRAGGQNGGLEHLFQRNTVVQIAKGLVQNGLRFDISTQTFTAGLNECSQVVQIQRNFLAAVTHHDD